MSKTRGKYACVDGEMGTIWGLVQVFLWLLSQELYVKHFAVLDVLAAGVVLCGIPSTS